MSDYDKDRVPREIVGGPYDGREFFLIKYTRTMHISHGSLVYQYLLGPDGRMHLNINELPDPSETSPEEPSDF